MQVRVRDARDSDAAAIAGIYRPFVEQSVASFEDVPPDADELLNRMQTSPRLPWLVADDVDAGIVGYAYAAKHRQRAAYRWSVDCSVYVRADAQARGIGRSLYDQLFPLLRRLGYYRIWAGITLPNPASVALHESAGFEPVGVYPRVGHKHGAWHDVGWWQLALNVDESAGPPAEPHPWRPAE